MESAPDEHIERFVVHKYVIPPQDLGPPHGESDSDGDEGSCVTPDVVSRRMAFGHDQDRCGHQDLARQ